MKRQKLLVIIGALIMVAAIPGAMNQAQATYYANSPIIPKFVDPLPAIPIASPIAPPPGVPADADYYEINAVQMVWQFHTNLPATTKVRGYMVNGGTYKYLGPMIVAQSYNPSLPAGVGGNGKPTRLKLTNLFPVDTTTTSTAGNLFLPVDTNLMGAGMGPLGVAGTNYPQNRSSLHLHGGVTPWISDGTPHQWITPAGEAYSYTKGESQRNVPDMFGGTPPAGSATYYYPNQESGRLMWYHDHSFGITRLNVYAGMAAPYLVHDSAEDALITAGTIPNSSTPPPGLMTPWQGTTWGIPLVIQDKTFVDTVAKMNGTPPAVPGKDPNWFTPAVSGQWATPLPGDLWFPHVYEFNQSSPATATTTFGVNPQGRWDYGPYVWPPATITASTAGFVVNPALGMPIPTAAGDVRDPSCVPEAFMDTMVVNGKAYPTLTVAPQAYRFRILNACNDRTLNLQLYYADNNGPWPAPATVNPLLPGYASNITPRSHGGTEVSMVKADGTVYTLSAGSANTIYTNAYLSPVQFGNPLQTENGVANVPVFYPGGATATVAVPFDGRAGGVPDPRNMGPQMIQIGNEGGLLPRPIVLANNPVDYIYDRKQITFGNVRNYALMGLPNPSNPTQVLNYPHPGYNIHMGPAERADVIIDFSNFAGATLIMYNDNPAPEPGLDPRNDYYTGNPDYSNTSATPALQMGGAPSTTAGNGPNTRTIMKITVTGTPGVAGTPFNLAALQTALPTYFAANQSAPLVPDGTGAAPAMWAPITVLGGQTFNGIQVYNKSIAEDFDPIWGRMNALLGTEQASTNSQGQQTFGFHFADTPTEKITNNSPRIWKFTHNGVDTHSIHFHLFNVQLVNRVDWAGVVKPPDPNEMGWKETVRMNPLEDIYVALKPKLPKVPFAVPPSIRPLDPTMPVGIANGPTLPPGATSVFWTALPALAVTPNFPFTNPGPGNVTLINNRTNFGNEYMMHCHLLGHEENDMMRAMVINNVNIHGWLDLLLLF